MTIEPTVGAVQGTARRRSGEEGGTLVLVLILLVILLVVAAVVIRGAASDAATAGYDRTGKAAFLCAESGIRIGVGQLAADTATYTTTLRCGSPDGGTPGCACSGSQTCPLRVNNDGGAYVDVWLSDDVDENPPDPLWDKNQMVYINSRCVQTGLPNRQLQILFGGSGGAEYYQLLGGQGSSNTGNQNVGSGSGS